MDFSKVILMTDLDGTLLTDDKRILPRDLEAIERFRAGGGLFTMATGRGYSMAKHIADKLRLDCPAVVYNGAAVYDFRQEKFLWQCEIGSFAADIIKRVAERYPDIGVEVLRGNVVHVPFLNDTEQWHLNLENVQADWSKLEDIPQDGWLKVLFAYPPEKMDELQRYVAAGDFMNDLAMIQSADLGAAVANAQPSVREAADIVLCDNNSGAMAQLIDCIERL